MAASLPSSRIILLFATVMAAGAVGVSVWRGQTVAPPADQPGSAAAPGAAVDPDVIIAQLESRLKTSPNDATGWRMLGEAQREAGRYAESAMALRRATALEPGNAQGWSMLGEALALASPPPMSPDARAAFKTAIARDPNDPLAAYYLAVAKDMDGDHQGAIDDWFALLDRSPADAPWITEVRGAIGSVATKYKINVTKRLAAAKAGPVPASAPGTAAATANAPPDAAVLAMVEGLARKLDADPGNVDGWIMLIRSRMALGQADKAQGALIKAKAANPAATSKIDAAAKALGLTPA